MGRVRGHAGSWLVVRHFLTDGVKAWIQNLGTDTLMLACHVLWAPHSLHTPFGQELSKTQGWAAWG